MSLPRPPRRPRLLAALLLTPLVTGCFAESGSSPAAEGKGGGGSRLRVALAFPPAERLSPYGADATILSRLGVTEGLTALDANGTAAPALAESWRRTGQLPAVVPPVVRHALLRLPGVALALASLGFLGLGAQPPSPEWGRLLAENQPYAERAPWAVLAPAAVLALLGALAVTASTAGTGRTRKPRPT